VELLLIKIFSTTFSKEYKYLPLMDSDSASQHSNKEKGKEEVVEEVKKEEVVEEKKEEEKKEEEKKEEEKNEDDGTHLIDDVPSDKVNLRLLRVNGSRSDILVNAKDTIDTVKQQIFDSWPKGWTDEVPTSKDNIKLLHYGKYLEDDSTIESHKMPEGQTTTVHLLIKFTKKELNEKDKEEGGAKETTACCCIIS